MENEWGTQKNSDKHTKGEHKRKALEQTKDWTKRHYLKSYKFWRGHGLHPVCSMRLVLRYTLFGLLVF
jgi:hypothetical protein